MVLILFILYKLFIGKTKILKHKNNIIIIKQLIIILEKLFNILLSKIQHPKQRNT